MRTHTYTHTYIHIYIYIYTCMHACIHTSIHPCMHPSMRACRQTWHDMTLHYITYISYNIICYMFLFFVVFIRIWANHFFLESTGPSAQASNIVHGMESGEGCTVPARGRSQCSCKLARNAGAATASQHISFQCQHCSCWACSRMASSDSLLENDGVEPGEERCSDLQHVHDNLYQSLRTAEILGPLWGYESIWGVQGQIHLQCHHQGMWKDGTVAAGHLLTAGHAAA